jgi:peptidoglycan/LPS O-acetylase OafA/YrhL
MLLAAALLLRMALGQASAPSRQGAVFIWLHHLPGMGVEFMFGVLAWRLAGRVRGWQRTALVLGGLAGWLCLAALFARWGDAGLDASLMRGQISWLAALCFAAMLAGSAHAGAQAPPRLVWLAQWAGKLSYGTYLLHMAALMLVAGHAQALGGGAAAGLVCAMTLAGAWALHLCWEEPWRRLGRRWARRLQTAQ